MNSVKQSSKTSISFLILMVLSASSLAMTKSSSTGPVSAQGEARSGADFSGGTQLAALPPASNPFGGGSDLMSQLANSASAGAGRLYDGAYCYRAVKKIIAHALQKNLNCVRNALPGGSAMYDRAASDAPRDLTRAGFRNDMSACNTPGVIRVYRGVRGGGRALKGDIHGHIEVLGSDGNFHHFTSSAQSIDKRLPGRRILEGCFVGDSASVDAGPLGKCSKSLVQDSGGNGRQRARGRGSRSRRR